MTPHTTPRTARRLRRRITGALAAAVVLAGAGLWTTDALQASRTERAIAATIQRLDNLPSEPRVTVGGVGYQFAAERGQWSTVSVDAADLSIPGWETTSFRAVVTKLRTSAEALRSGDVAGARVATWATQVQINGVIIGDWLGVPDATIRRVANVSPNGGKESDAVIEGTIPNIGYAEVAVHLRIRAGAVSLEPYDVLKGPSHATSDGSAPTVKGKTLPDSLQQAIKGFYELTLQPDQIPLNGAPDYVYCEGESIAIQTSDRNRVLSDEDLAPVMTVQQDPTATLSQRDEYPH